MIDELCVEATYRGPIILQRCHGKSGAQQWTYEKAVSSVRHHGYERYENYLINQRIRSVLEFNDMERSVLFNEVANRFPRSIINAYIDLNCTDSCIMKRPCRLNRLVSYINCQNLHLLVNIPKNRLYHAATSLCAFKFVHFGGGGKLLSRVFA